MDYPDYEFHDTLKAARKAFPCAPNHQLHTISALCGYDLTMHHHALADAEACARIAIEILQNLPIPSEIVSILALPPCSKKTKDKTENHDKDNDVT